MVAHLVGARRAVVIVEGTLLRQGKVSLISNWCLGGSAHLNTKLGDEGGDIAHSLALNDEI